MKKIFAIILCIAVALSLCAVSASAVTVNLTSTQMSNTSTTIAAKSTNFSGSNSSASARAVIFTAQAKEGLFWSDTDQRTVAKGAPLGTTASFAFAANLDWRLELNPEGSLTTGCTATGTIVKRT